MEELFIRMFTLLEWSKAFDEKKFMDGIIEGKAWLYSAETKKPIAPCRLQRQDHGCWIWVHPAATLEVLQELECLKKEYSSFSFTQIVLNRFELRGARCTDMLQHTLRVCEKDSTSSLLWKSLQNLRSSSSLPEGVVLSLSVYDPRLK